MTVLRSLFFLIYFALLSASLSIVLSPFLLLPQRYAYIVPKTWAALSLWGLRVLAGLDYEVRGEIPRGAVLIASKHMSMWDTIALFFLIADPVIILKRQLLFVPFYGWYVWKMRMIPIDREGHASALRSMVKAARAALDRGRPILIFPEGTRTPPGQFRPYKPGIAALYKQLQVPCIPVALNSGLYWTGPGGFLKKRGTITIEFLPAIAAGLKRDAFMERLQSQIEEASTKLVEAGRKELGQSAA